MRILDHASCAEPPGAPPARAGRVPRCPVRGLVLVQAVLIASIIAHAFWARRSATFQLVLLALAFAGQSILTWGFEVAGRRAASEVLSELRLDCMERRLPEQPARARRRGGRRDRGTAVQGVNGPRPFSPAYMPQVVHTIVVPVAVLGLVVTIDPISAG